MKRTCFNQNWSFNFQGKAETVNLPHDYSIHQKRDGTSLSGPGNGYFPGGIADYQKKLFAPEAWKGQKTYLLFEGVYMNATVRVNHQMAAWHPYGYTSFVCDITPFLRYGCENLISVNVNNNALPNSRWYSGSGIYRPVWLMTAQSIHIPPYGVSVATPDLHTANIATIIENANGESLKIKLRHRILDGSSKEVAAAETEYVCVIGENTAECRIDVPTAAPWSVENPNLYTLKTEILCDDRVLDESETVFGFRTVSFDAKEGFSLNGISMNLKGGCVHHDCGILGSAAFERAEERKVEILKQNGYNAVRCAHNPPSPAFLNACDRLGMLVIDEAFDVWREEKMPFDYHLYFADWWKRDMTSMILRDRNHPSVILWSTGNEILERDGRSDGYATARELADFVRSLDPTRKVTNALCEIWGENIFKPELSEEDQADEWGALTKAFAEPLDVVGYNYMLSRYEEDGRRFPGRILYGSETFPKESYDNWCAVEKLPYVVGDFVWTAWDYLGEAGIGHIWYNGENTFCGKHPWNQAYCGDIDICGFKRPQSYYRDFVWGIGTVPYIAVYKPEFYGKEADISRWGWPDVAGSWTWPGYEDKPVEIEVYAGGDEVELFLNGASLGRKPAGKAYRYTAKYETRYKPGELTAVTYENGVETYRRTLKTAGTPVQIRLTADRDILTANGNDLSFVTVEIFDQNGNPAHQAVNELYFTVSGAGCLQAVGNSDPQSDEMYVGAVRRANFGRAMAVVRANKAGTAVLQVSAEGLPAASITLTIQP